MIKSLKHYQIQLTPFESVKNWSLNNIDNDNLFVTEDDFPIALEFIDYNDNGTPIDNDNCDISIEQQETDSITQEQGLKISGPIYTETEPLNFNGTYKRSIYHQIKTMFYNFYLDPSKIWGVENIDFESSKTKRKLSDEFRLIDIPKKVFGDKISPSTIKMLDNTLDNFYIISDDGNGNLLAGDNLFSKQQEIGDFNNSFNTSSNSSNCNSFFYFPDLCSVSGITGTGGGDTFNCYDTQSSILFLPYVGNGFKDTWNFSGSINSIDYNENDGRFVMGSSQISRTLSIGNDWNVIRLAMLFGFTDVSSSLTDSPQFYFGLMSNPDNPLTNGPLSSNTSHFIGLKTFDSSWSRSTGFGQVSYFSNSAKIIKKVGSTETTSSSTTTILSELAASPDVADVALYLEITKGDDNYTFQTVFASGGQGIDGTDVSKLISGINKSTLSSITSLYSSTYTVSTSVNFSVDENDGILNALCCAWNKTNSLLKISEFYWRKIS